MRCPKCGKPYNEGEFIGPFCKECYEIKWTMDKIVLEVCKECGRVKIRGEWKKWKNETIKELIISHVKGDFDYIDVDFDKEKIILGKEGKKFVEVPLKIKIKKVLCPECYLRRSNYFEAIIQLRGNEKEIPKMERKLKELLSGQIVKREEKKEGVDLYIFSGKKMLEVLHTLHLPYKITRKLVGLKEGKRRYRMTVVIRKE